jgi:hypothetical protein
LLYTDDEIRLYNITLCDVCRSLETLKEHRDFGKKEAKCCLCHSKEGVLKQLRDKNIKWTHLNCINWFGFVKLKKENDFSFFQVEAGLPSNTWTGDCSICDKMRKDDFLVKCADKNCNKYFHTKCIKEKLKDNIKSETSNVIGLRWFKCADCSKGLFI